MERAMPDRGEYGGLCWENAGRWPKGTMVRKVNTKLGDAHQDGALGTIVGASGPTTASQQIFPTLILR